MCSTRNILVVIAILKSIKNYKLSKIKNCFFIIKRVKLQLLDVISWKFHH